MLLSPSWSPAPTDTNSPLAPQPVVDTSPMPLAPTEAPLTSPVPPAPADVLPPTSSMPPVVSPVPPPLLISPQPLPPPPEAPTPPVEAPPPTATPIASPSSPFTPPVITPALPPTPLALTISPPSQLPRNSPPYVILPSPPPPNLPILQPPPSGPNDPLPPPPLPNSSIMPPQTAYSPMSSPLKPSSGKGSLPVTRHTFHLPTGLLVFGFFGVVVLLFVLGIFYFFYEDRKKKKHSPLEENHKPLSLEPKDNSSGILPQNVVPPGAHAVTSLNLTTNSEQAAGSMNKQSGNLILHLPPGVVLGLKRGNFTYDELVMATNGFSDANLLGQGGFGYVHKGVLPNGREVAVKQLRKQGNQGEHEFQAEIETISRVHHKHLVSLVGYCITEAERLLVYEFLPNNTLEHHLHGKGQQVMEWATRLKIAIGCAKGLAYLHEDCNPTIIHRDIKAANILLDSKFEAKVSDFGLAKIFCDTNINVTHISTRVIGTFGYLAPEYAASGKVTNKSDVYSYGVMLLELITGRSPIFAAESSMTEGLVVWARPLLAQALEDGNFDALIDPRLEGSYNVNEVASMVACAAACVRHSAQLRPQMSQIVRTLERDVPLKDFREGIRAHDSSGYSSPKYQEVLKKFSSVWRHHQYGGGAPSGTTSEYGLNPSSSSSDDTKEIRLDVVRKYKYSETKA